MLRLRIPHGNSNRGDRATRPRSRAAVVATFGFGTLGAAYAALLGTPEYDMYTKALVFTLVSAVMSSLGRVAGPLGSPRRDKNAAACVVFLSSILPIVAVPLAAKVASSDK
ncbi:hypothetical protein C2845_PM07G26990 [Panicum miliaceum]|uniref:Uncharacterized protein n=1 Tax=Panicum miliaceum TaxID=4540 RepID=A0A3L6SIZ6_PANMI|nr:hypothetical protein C2845_PM07G26990 [Panicum miliaceum]